MLCDVMERVHQKRVRGKKEKRKEGNKYGGDLEYYLDFVEKYESNM